MFLSLGGCHPGAGGGTKSSCREPCTNTGGKRLCSLVFRDVNQAGKPRKYIKSDMECVSMGDYFVNYCHGMSLAGNVSKGFARHMPGDAAWNYG